MQLFRTLFLDLLVDRQTRLIFIYVALMIVITAAVFHWLEGWGWLDSIYFVVITIGYGDFAPTTPLTKLITIYVVLNGMAILLMLFDEIRHVRAWHTPDVPAPEERNTRNQAIDVN